MTDTLRIELSNQQLEQLADLIATRINIPTASTEEAGYLTVEAAADYLGLTVEAVRHMYRRRTIPHVQHERGGRVMFRRADLDQHMDEGHHNRRTT